MREGVALWAGSLVIVLLATGGSGNNGVWTGQCASFLDSAGNHVLPYNGGGTDENTPAYCIALCRKKQYKFAGVEWGSRCYCGHTAPVTTVPMAQCYEPCPGDSSKKCGGAYRMNVYSVTGGCELGPWTGWSECPVTCGGDGSTAISRTRDVIRKADPGGAQCGKKSETKRCNTQPCPVDCQERTERLAGNCSVSCGVGERNVTLNVAIISPARNNGKPCNMTKTITEECDTGEPCPTASTMPPPPLVPDGILKVEIGDPVVLDCRVESVSSDSLIWRKGKEEQESSGGLLYIPKLARDQAGTYTCTDDTKRVIKTVKIEVSGPETYRHLVIGLGAGITIAPISLCLLVIWVKKCRKKPEDENEDDFAGDQNEDYGIYYSPQGERVEIESEVTDVNP